MKQLGGLAVLALAAWLLFALLGPGAAPAAAGEFTSAQQCAECHQEQYAEWQDSWHAKAWIDEDVRQRFELPETASGVVIIEVRGDSAAAEENLRPGDIIVEVGQEEVNSPPEIVAKVREAQDDDKKSVLLLIDRQGDLRFVALRFS